VESSQELQCLNAATKQNGTSWRGNFNYWSSGTQQGCRGAWNWCSRTGPRPFDDSFAPWDSGQPDNKGGREDCIHLRLANSSSSGPKGFFLNDRNCTNKYVLACKVRLMILSYVIILSFCLVVYDSTVNHLNFREIHLVWRLAIHWTAPLA
jgi:hypothetical protein